MVSFAIGRMWKAAAGIMLVLIAVAAPSPVLSQGSQPLPPPTESDSLEAEVERIREIQSLHGATSPHLIDPLKALGLFYMEEGEHHLAQAAMERARHLVRVNYGFSTFEEAPLLRQLVRIERAKGNAEVAWELEQTLLAVLRQHPNELRAAPIFLEIANQRMDVLNRYAAGEFPPEIILGCYYSQWRLQDGVRYRTGCRAGSRGAVIGALSAEVDSYRRAAWRIASRHERWLALPCARPRTPDVPHRREISRRQLRSVETEVLEYLSGMADYVACVQAKYEHAEDASEPPSELSRLASDKEAAVEELEELRALYEARIGPVMGLAR